MFLCPSCNCFPGFKTNLIFEIQMMIMLKKMLPALLLLLTYSLNSTAQSKKYKLVWSDEFEKPGLPDSTKWSYDKGMGCPDNCGWGNDELEYYTTSRLENARVENGQLIIEVKKEKFENASYTSARLSTKHKADWKYGRIEVKAMLPKGKGTWPAIWMLSTNWEYGGWPESGEIDIMENVGYEPDSVFGTVHTKSYNHVIHTQRSQGLSYPDLSSAFHVYAVEWTADMISFFVDDKKYMEFKNEHTGSSAWPFDKEFHLLLNVAVGGGWGGKHGVDDKIFPQKMIVDYVRVYQ